MNLYQEILVVFIVGAFVMVVIALFYQEIRRNHEREARKQLEVLRSELQPGCKYPLAIERHSYETGFTAFSEYTVNEIRLVEKLPGPRYLFGLIPTTDRHVIKSIKVSNGYW